MSFIGVGVDVSKQTLDVALHGDKSVHQFTNDPTGFKALIKWLKPLAADQIVLEATGGYEQKALDALYAAGLPVVRVNARRARSFAIGMGELAKTDRLDARMLAVMASASSLIPYRSPGKDLVRLKQFYQRRVQIVQMLTAEKQRRRLIDEPAVRAMLEASINRLEKDRARLDAAIAKQVEGTLQAQVLSPIKGVGPVCVATVICEMPELGYLNRKSAAKLYGVAPLPRDSGTYRGPRITWGGRAHPRSMIYMVALSAARSDPVIKAFYEGLIARGKRKKVALVAVMRKLIGIFNARLRDALKDQIQAA
jgi:transposase